MILSEIGYGVSLRMSDFFDHARNKEEFELQLRSLLEALHENGPSMIAMGVIDSDVVHLFYHLGTEASEVKNALQKVQMLMVRDGDPWWVRAARGEAAEFPSDEHQHHHGPHEEL